MTNNTTNVSINSEGNMSQCLVLQHQDFVPWNNPDNIIDFQTEELVRKLKMLVFMPITFVIGVPANVINMVVFYKHGLKERINVCLFALSLADSLYLVFNMLIVGEQLYIQFTTGEKYGPIREWIINHYLLGFNGLIWVSQVISAIVACERCFCIMQPLKSQTILHSSTMTAIIVAVFILVIGFRLIVNSRYNAVCAYDPVSDKIIKTVTGSKFYYRHQTLVDFLEIFVYSWGIPWLVIILVITTTIITVIKLRQAAEWRAGMSSSSVSVFARDIALTRMLVGNSIFFIACVFPAALFRTFPLFMPEMKAGRRHHNLFMLRVWFGQILSYINATFNIVVYYTMGSRYRQTVRALLGRKITKDNPTNGVMTTCSLKSGFK